MTLHLRSIHSPSLNNEPILVPQYSMVGGDTSKCAATNAKQQVYGQPTPAGSRWCPPHNAARCSSTAISLILTAVLGPCSTLFDLQKAPCKSWRLSRKPSLVWSRRNLHCYCEPSQHLARGTLSKWRLLNRLISIPLPPFCHWENRIVGASRHVLSLLRDFLGMTW